MFLPSLSSKRPNGNSQYRLSPATMRDVHAVRRLELLIFPKDAYSYLNLSTLLVWPGSANYKMTTPDDVLIGFVSGTPNFATHVDWIVTLGVHPEYQGRGYGRQLLNAAESHMTQDRIRLTVRESNRTARHLYETSGYVFAYRETHYYNDGEDGLVLEKIRTR